MFHSWAEPFLGFVENVKGSPFWQHTSTNRNRMIVLTTVNDFEFRLQDLA